MLNFNRRGHFNFARKEDILTLPLQIPINELFKSSKYDSIFASNQAQLVFDL